MIEAQLTSTQSRMLLLIMAIAEYCFDGAEDWSLKCCMTSCLDFANEITALQHVGSQLGVPVSSRKKIPAEMAGSGVENSFAKGMISKEASKSKFSQLSS